MLLWHVRSLQRKRCSHRRPEGRNPHRLRSGVLDADAMDREPPWEGRVEVWGTEEVRERPCQTSSGNKMISACQPFKEAALTESQSETHGVAAWEKGDMMPLLLFYFIIYFISILLFFKYMFLLLIALQMSPIPPPFNLHPSPSPAQISPPLLPVCYFILNPSALL